MADTGSDDDAMKLVAPIAAERLRIVQEGFEKKDVLTVSSLSAAGHILNSVNSLCGRRSPQKCCSQHSLARVVPVLP